MKPENNQFQLPSTPDNPDSGRGDDVSKIRAQLSALYSQTGDDMNPGHLPVGRPDPTLDRAAYEKWYHQLSHEEKHAEWERYHHHMSTKKTARGEAHLHHKGTHNHQKMIVGGKKHARPKEQKPDTVSDLKERIFKATEQGARSFKKKHGRALAVAFTVGLVFLLLNYNSLLLGQVKAYISPGNEIATPVILDPNAEVPVSNEPKIIIPKINVDVPVVYDEKSYDEGRIQQALERGVVHYGNTAVPGQVGNNVVVGHSSNNFFNTGKYKFAFVLLERLEIGDTFVLHYNGARYIYKVFNKQIISPDDFSLIQPTEKPITTLITCTPPGTSWRRMVVQGEQIAPNPDSAQKATTELPQEINTPVPGNAPSLFQKIRDWLF